MKTLFNSIENGTLPMHEGLIIVIVVTLVVLVISYLLPEIKKAK